jgi:hypothetical protein
MRLRTVVAALVAALALPAVGGSVTGNPQRFELGWVEHARKNGRIVMTFRVEQVHLQFGAFAAEVEFHNRSTRTIRVRPQFALLVSRTKTADANNQALLVRRSAPKLPTILFPGQRWKGVMSGTGRPRNDMWVRFNFGFFAVKNLYADQPNGFAWITDHVFQIGQTA